MRKRLIVDFRIAAAERDTLSTPDWNWPVAQPTYDDPLREFVEWSQTLPAQLIDNPELRIAYELIESDLLVDIASIVSAWIDVSTARKNDMDLAFGNDLRLYEMLQTDAYDAFSPIGEARIAGEQALRNPVRRISRLAKKTLKRINSQFRGIPNYHLTNANPLLLEITGGPDNLLRFTHAELAAQRPNQAQANQSINDLATEIQEQLTTKLEQTGNVPSAKFNSYIRSLVSKYLTNGIFDQQFKPGFSPSPNMTLFTGTGGGYLARTVAHAFQKNGAKVIRTTHGGDTSLFSDPLWRSTELPFSDTYVTFGTEAANEVSNVSESHSTSRKVPNTRKIVSGGSHFHQKIVNDAQRSSKVKNVYVISASFSGKHRAIPNVKIHDIVYLEWHRRLLKRISEAGYEVFAKRHPKGTGADIPIFDDIATVELRQTRMAATFSQADAYVLDIAGSAFIEALCTLKPVILIDIPTRRLIEKARTQLQKSVVIVRANFDDKNLVAVDHSQISEGLQKPVDLDARRQFIFDYLTSYDSQIAELKALAQLRPD
jgi:hypothetical protein